MALENKLGLTSSADLAREEERLSKKKAVELFENGFDCWEIEEMLMEPEVVRQYIEEIAYVQGYYV